MVWVSKHFRSFPKVTVKSWAEEIPERRDIHMHMIQHINKNNQKSWKQNRKEKKWTVSD